MSFSRSNMGARGVTTSPIKSPKTTQAKRKVKSTVSEPLQELILPTDESDHGGGSDSEEDGEDSGMNFFERYQKLMRQKQISHYSKVDRSVLLVVKDDSVLPTRKASTKKRRGSAPSIQSPGGTMSSPGPGLGSPGTGLRSPKGSSMRSARAASRAPGSVTFRSPDGQLRTPFSPEPSPGRRRSTGGKGKSSKSKGKQSSGGDDGGGLFLHTEVVGLGSPGGRSGASSPDACDDPLESPIPKRLSKYEMQRQLSDLQALSSLGATSEVARLSPRSKYLNACIQENVFPRQALMKKVTETSINIQNQGLGDKMTAMFMECYRDSTTLESVNLTDNNLTDRGLAPAISAISGIPSLAYVNISENAMGPRAAEALLALLDTDHCPLRQLVLRKCALDDLHCQCFVAALLKEAHFSNLIELNMSNNKLGSSEVVNASNQTTGEAIATWLSRPECILQSLDLSWNTIRSHTGVVLSTSLAANRSLTRLDLSYNGLGTEGGAALGAALIHNQTLKFLSVSNNSLDSVATFTICAGIMENTTLEELILDSNPIGEKGATALMMIPLIHFGRVKLSAKQCNLTIKDANCWFNFNKLPGRYVLKMSEPYERAVALVLLRLVAFHQSCEFERIDYDPTGLFLDASTLGGHANGAAVVKTKTGAASAAAAGGGGSKVTKEIQLEPKYINREHLFDDSQRRILAKMKRMIAGSADAMHAMKLFREVDVDGSNGIDKHELELLMTSLGIHLSDYRLRETMATYDTDGNGSIDTEEFSCFLNHMKHEVDKHRFQLVSLPVLGLASGGGSGAVGSNIGGNLVTQRRHPTASALSGGDGTIDGAAIVHSNRYGNCNNNEGRYVPPLTGSFLMQVFDSHTYKDVVYTVASCNRRYSDIVAQNTPDPDALKRATLSLTQIRVDDAVGICQAIAKKKKNVIHVLVNLLHQVSCVADARLLISEVIDGDRSKMVKLRREMGHSLKTALGMLNGYYCLDLSEPTERKTLVSLYEQSRTLNHHQAMKSPLGYGLIGDTSQKGNWSSFRNELYDGRPVVVDEEFIATLPAYGNVEFDYSGETRFKEGDDVVTKDFAVVTMLVHVGLVRAADLDATMASLKDMRIECNACNASTSGRTIYERTWADALEIAKHSCSFYENLVSRPDYLDRAKVLERLQIVATESLNSTAGSTGSNSKSGSMKRKNGQDGRGDVNETPQRRLKPFEVTESEKKALAAHLPNPRLYDPDNAVKAISPEKALRRPGLSRGNSVHNSPVPVRKQSSGGQSSSNNTPVKRHVSAPGDGFGSPSASRKTSSLAQVVEVNNSSSNAGLLSPSGVSGLGAGRSGAEVASFWRNHVLDNGHGLDDDEADEYDLLGTGSMGLGSSGGGFGMNGAPTEEYVDDTTKGDHFYGVIKAATSDEHAAYFASIIQNENVPDEVKMAKLLDIIEESFGCYKWINARHLALILNCIECLPFGMVNRSKFFGNYRVDIVVMLFGHIVDRCNFDLVLKELTPYETACVIARIGVMNFANPMRPEGSHSLDLSLWDQRQLAKMYALLEVTEPGENWTNKQFRWIIDQPPIPSWVLTKMWMTEEGMPARGILDLTYYSGEGVGKNNCQPCIPYRKSLLFMTSLNEGDIREEDLSPNQNPFKELPEEAPVSDAGDGASVGLTVLRQNIDIWREYVCRNYKVAGPQMPVKPVTAPRRVRKAIGFSPAGKGSRQNGNGNGNAMDITPTKAIGMGGTPVQSPSVTLLTTAAGGPDGRLSHSSAKTIAKSMTKLSLSAVKRGSNSAAPTSVRGITSASPRMKSLQSASMKQLLSPRAQPKASARPGTGKAPARTVSTMKPNITPRSVSTPRTRPGSSSAGAGAASATTTTKSSKQRSSLGSSRSSRLDGKPSSTLETILSPGVGVGDDGDASSSKRTAALSTSRQATAPTGTLKRTSTSTYSAAKIATSTASLARPGSGPSKYAHK